MIAFLAMIAFTVMLLIAAYAIPLRIVPFNALPWAFRIDFNLDLDFQTVTYATVHNKRIAQWSHLTMPLEQVAWAIVLLWIHPVAFAAVLAFVLWQALRLGEPPLVYWLVATWVVVSALGAFCWLTFGTAALTASMILLLAGPVLRFFGHAVEPIPPFVGQDDDAFIPVARVRISPSVLLLPLSGTVSEFAAALPYRLIVVQVFWLAQQFGYKPRNANAWSRARVLGGAIRENGWKAYGKTEQLFASYKSSVATTPAPSVVVDG
jgi:hypothetical protein